VTHLPREEDEIRTPVEPRDLRDRPPDYEDNYDGCENVTLGPPDKEEP
jgi:hypothetical protein